MAEGVRLSVWAPRARTVSVVLNDDKVACTPAPAERGGWWDGPVVPSGTDYRFALDGGPARPDPRSRWQPHGVHGASRALDLEDLPRRGTRFRAPPIASALIYELHVGTFTPEGTFRAAVDRLEHLVELGVTHVELMPVNAFPGVRGWGYDGVGLYAPHDPYGGPAGLVQLVDACHERGLAVLLDVVYNHLGPDGNYLGEFGPYFSQRHHTPWGAAVNLDGPGSAEVRRFFIDNARLWLRDYRIDGLRLDAVHALVDTSATPFLEELQAEVDALAAAEGRPLVLVAESDLNDPRLLRAPEAGGYGLGAQWSDDFHHALHATLTGESNGYYADFHGAADLARVLQHGWLYQGQHSTHRGRAHGRRVHDIPGAGRRLLGYAQTHDQVGNRARGERLSHLCGVRLAKIGAAVTLLAPFVPMLFQGEEWATKSPFQYFTDHESPELQKAVRDGRRAEFAAFGWAPEDVPDPQDAATFARSKLAWDELGEELHAGVFAWYRMLASLRANEPALRDGRLENVEVRQADHWLEMTRGNVTLVVNFGGGWVERGKPPGKMVLASEPTIVDAEPLRMAPESAAIWLT